MKKWLVILLLVPVVAHGALFTVITNGVRLTGPAVAEIYQVYREHQAAIGELTVITNLPASDNIQAMSVGFWTNMQFWVQDNADQFVNHTAGPFTNTAGFTMWTLAALQIAAGLTNTAGAAASFRRTDVWTRGAPPNWLADVDFTNGTMQVNDIIGPWVWIDLQNCFSLLKHTVEARTQLGSSSDTNWVDSFQRNSGDATSSGFGSSSALAWTNSRNGYAGSTNTTAGASPADAFFYKVERFANHNAGTPSFRFKEDRVSSTPKITAANAKGADTISLDWDLYLVPTWNPTGGPIDWDGYITGTPWFQGKLSLQESGSTVGLTEIVASALTGATEPFLVPPGTNYPNIGWSNGSLGGNASELDGSQADEAHWLLKWQFAYTNQ